MANLDMEPLAELGRRLQTLREAQAFAPANVQPSQPQGYGGPMPNFQAMQLPFGGQRYMGNVDMPFGGGDLGVSGAYSRFNSQSPPNWQALLNYHKSF